MAKSRDQIQRESDARRGVKLSSYKFHVDFLALLSQLSEQTGKSRTAIIVEAVTTWAAQQPRPKKEL